MTAQTPDARPMLVTKDIRVSSYDIDFMGIVSNIVYIRWFEDLRFAFLDRYWPFEDMRQSGQSPILSKTTVEYRAPLTIADKPVGRLWVDDLGKALWKMSIEIATTRQVHCVGHQEGYIYDLTRKKPVRLPVSLIERFCAESGQKQ